MDDTHLEKGTIDFESEGDSEWETSSEYDGYSGDEGKSQDEGKSHPEGGPESSDLKSNRKDDDSEARVENQSEGETLEMDGKTIRVTRLDWKWDSLNLKLDENGYVLKKKQRRVTHDRDPRDVADLELVPFRVLHNVSSKTPRPEQLYVHIKSSTLLGTVEKLLPSAKQHTIFSDYNFVGIKGKDLFLALDELKGELHQTGNAIKTGGGKNVATLFQLQRQLQHLVQFLDKEYAETSAQYVRMDPEALVSWEMLWTFLRPGVEVVYKDCVCGEEACGIVENAYYKKDRGDWKFEVTFKVFNYNCKSFTSYSCSRKIDQFEGEVMFHGLGVYPFRFSKEPKAFEKKLLDRGTKFGYLSTQVRCRYMFYMGIMFKHDGHGRLMKEKANGRVMVDLASFWRMNPNYYRLGDAEPPNEIIHDNKVNEIDISRNPNRKFAPCIVYGFSFQLKKWGAFSVDGFDEIKYNDCAWDEVVTDPNLKEMTDILVSEHLRRDIAPDSLQQSGLDTIANKGESCIVLSHGPPGTGKTLTAEALADKQRAPLWAMSVSELGITPDTLEGELLRIFDVAHSWRALLLLDEADVYLERRSDGFDLKRNAMTGIFLRQLEYYKGVLFLTTNRESTFDEAFLSRITFFLRFKALDKDQRKQIWANFFTHVKIAADENVSEIVDKLSVYNLNGRQIRNAIQNAGKAARRRGSEMLSGEILMKAAEVMDKSVAGGRLDLPAKFL